VLVLALIVVAGMLTRRPLWADGSETGSARSILVLTNPIHTDIAIPIDPDVRARFAFLEEAGMPTGDPQVRWLIFGWGGRSFYLETPTWAELKPGPLFRALTLDRSVMHVDIAGAIPDQHPAVTRFEIGDAEFARLTEFIAASFAPAGGEPLVIAGRGYGATDQFYEAEGRFNALVGCNTWTARALRAAGLQTGWWNPLPLTLAKSLEIHN
jgi:uncharacterized protein (TIGR02117 family)